MSMERKKPLKKLLSTVIVLALLGSLPSCAAASLPSGPVQETTAPATTSAPPSPTPEPLTEEEQIARLASVLEGAAGAFSLEGSLQLVFADRTERRFVLSGQCALPGKGFASVAFSSSGEDAVFGALTIADRELLLLWRTADGEEAVRRFSELPLYGALAERSEEILSELFGLSQVLRESAAELDALLLLSGIEIGSGELLSLISLFGRAYAEGLRSIGIEPPPVLEGEGTAADAARALYALCAEYDGEQELLTISPMKLLSLAVRLCGELEARLDRTLASILDELLGEGRTAQLYRRLASYEGNEPLSAWRHELESILIASGFRSDSFYRLLALVLDRALSAEITAERLQRLFDENAERSLDSVLSLCGGKRTYADFLRYIHSILSMSPTSLYTAFGGTGVLAERLRETRACLDRCANALDLSLSLDLQESGAGSALLSVSFMLPDTDRAAEDGSCVGFSLLLTLSELLE